MQGSPKRDKGPYISLRKQTMLKLHGQRRNYVMREGMREKFNKGLKQRARKLEGSSSRNLAGSQISSPSANDQSRLSCGVSPSRSPSLMSQKLGARTLGGKMAPVQHSQQAPDMRSFKRGTLPALKDKNQIKLNLADPN
jgi:hypothetical protein